MRQLVSFQKLKLTNNHLDPFGHVSPGGWEGGHGTRGGLPGVPQVLKTLSHAWCPPTPPTKVVAMSPIPKSVVLPGGYLLPWEDGMDPKERPPQKMEA